MKELTPCLFGNSTTANKCDSYAEEISDVRAFQAMLADFFKSTEDGSPRASSVLVALHNIVTSTVPVKFKKGRHRYYCIAEVLQKLKASAVLQDGSLQLGPNAPRTRPLPGVGQHRLQNCSS